MTVFRGVVRKVDADGPHVEIAELGQGFVFGPCESPFPVSKGDRVVVGSIGELVEDVVILGRMEDPEVPPHDHDSRYFTEAESDARFQPIGSVNGRPDTGWITLPLQSPWVDDDATVGAGSWRGAQYRRTNGFVELRGLVKGGNGTTTSTIAVMPPGFRPYENEMFSQAAETGVYRVDAYTTGSLSLESVLAGTGSDPVVYLDLGRIRYEADGD